MLLDYVFVSSAVAVVVLVFECEDNNVVIIQQRAPLIKVFHFVRVLVRRLLS